MNRILWKPVAVVDLLGIL